MTAAARPSPLGPPITARSERQPTLAFNCDNDARILRELNARLAGHGHSVPTSEGFHDRAFSLEPLKPQERGNALSWLASQSTGGSNAIVAQMTCVPLIVM